MLDYKNLVRDPGKVFFIKYLNQLPSNFYSI